jgi:hypothetical protein
VARQLVQSAVDVLRDAHMVLNPATGVWEASVLLEGARTYMGVRSEPTTAQLASSGNVANATGFEAFGLSNGIAFGAPTVLRHAYVGATLTVSTQYTVSFYIVMDDGGVPAPSGGTTTGDFCVAINGGIMPFSGITTRQVEGTLYRTFKVSGYQCEQAAFASSYYRTTGSAAARSADAYSRALVLAPQGMLLYSKHVEQGTAFVPGARLWQVGAAADTNPRLLVYCVASGRYVAEWDNLAGTARASSLDGVTGGAVALGNLVELICVLRPDGALQLHQSVNGAAPVSATVSAALALPTAWSEGRVHVNSVGASAAGFNAFLPNARGELVTIAAEDFSTHTAAALFSYARAAFAEA